MGDILRDIWEIAGIYLEDIWGISRGYIGNVWGMSWEYLWDVRGILHIISDTSNPLPWYLGGRLKDPKRIFDFDKF